MRLSNDVQKCVVFIGPEQGEDIVLAGTGFLLKDREGPDATVYLVTARHVAEGLPGPIGLRFNTKEGRFRVHPIPRPEWVYHYDKNVDVAAMVFDPPAWAETMAFPTKYIATDFKIETKDFGPGDFVYVVGLYRLLKETKRNIPLVHTGHIAAMLGNQTIPVVDPHTKERRHSLGYLVESRAVSGASGSPVFVRRTIKHQIPAPESPKNQLNAATAGSLWFLGMWSQSWPGEPEQNLIEGANLPKDVKVPVGIGLVVPGPFIQEMFGMPELKKQRDQFQEQKESRSRNVARYGTSHQGG